MIAEEEEEDGEKKNLHDGSWLRWMKSDKNVDGNGGAWISTTRITSVKNIVQERISKDCFTLNDRFDCWWILIMMILKRERNGRNGRFFLMLFIGCCCIGWTTFVVVIFFVSGFTWIRDESEEREINSILVTFCLSIENTFRWWNRTSTELFESLFDSFLSNIWNKWLNRTRRDEDGYLPEWYRL